MSFLTGAFIDFDVRRPTVRLHQSDLGDRRTWSVGFELYFGGWHEKVRVSTGEEELSKLDGRVGFTVRAKDIPADVAGELIYAPGRDDDLMPSPPGYSVFLMLEQEDHDRLVSLVQDGVPLRKLTIKTDEGVAYGWEPDGSGKDWDNKQFPKVKVRGFTLQFGTDEDDSLDEEAEPSRSILEERAPPDPFKREALAKLTEVSTRLGWLLMLLVFAIIMVVASR